MTDFPRKDYIIIDFQWFLLNKKSLIPKELASYDSFLHKSHFIFEPLVSFNTLSDSDKRAARYAFTHHHGLKWEDGYTPTNKFNEIVKRLCSGVNRVFVKGSEKKNFLKNIVDIEIIDLVGEDRIIRDIPQCTFHVGTFAVCALTNVERISEAILQKRQLYGI